MKLLGGPTRRLVLSGTGGALAVCALGSAAPCSLAQAVPPQRSAIGDLTPRELAAYAAALHLAMAGRAHPAMSQTAGQAYRTPWDRACLSAFEAVLRAVDPPRTGTLLVPYVDIGAPLPPAFADPASPLHVGRSPQPLLWSTHAWIDRVWTHWESALAARGGALPAGQVPVLWLAGDRAEIRLRPAPAGSLARA